MNHQPFGINVIGYVSSNVSLGITARHFIKLFLEKDIPVSIFDIDFKRAPNARTFEYDHLKVAPNAELPYSINLFFLAATGMASFFRNPPPGVLSKERLNAGLIWYELNFVPKYICEGLRLLDVLIAGSGYVRQLLAANVSGVLTLECKHPIFLPPDINPNRSRFNLPEKDTLFIYSFDPHHDPVRKNPFGAIDAFLRAFPNQENVGLVIKLNNAEVKQSDCDPHVLVRELKARCDSNPRVHFIAKSLSYRDVLSLYASCDVFISLHRSEGLGMGPLECMLLGKPVIATAWSGNMSYMKHTNTCLVGSDLVPYLGVGADGPNKLGKRVRWAEPRIDEAADWMKKLSEDRSLRERIGLQAAKDAATYHSAALQADFIDELKCISNERSFLKGRQNEKWIDTSALSQAYREVRHWGWRGMRTRIMDGLDRHLLWRFR